MKRTSQIVLPAAECTRCGTCCRKGGPGFHLQDRMLIDKGLIPAGYLYTIRRGEFAYDNVKECLTPVASDIIKIKGRGAGWTCIFLDEIQKKCRIYDDRPLECRALKCWDTRELEQLYAAERLTRRDLISNVKGLWDLIEDHQTRCGYPEIGDLIEGLTTDIRRKRAQKKLLEIIRYDAEIRKLAVSRGGLDPEMLDFVFGRALTKTLPNYGLEIRQVGSNFAVRLKT